MQVSERVHRYLAIAAVQIELEIAGLVDNGASPTNKGLTIAAKLKALRGYTQACRMTLAPRRTDNISLRMETELPFKASLCSGIWVNAHTTSHDAPITTVQLPSFLPDIDSITHSKSVHWNLTTVLLRDIEIDPLQDLMVLIELCDSPL